MSTPSVPTTKPDRPAADPRPERRPSETATTPPQVLPASPADRAADADLLVDIPQLVVDELTLELESSLVLNRLKLDAKGLQLGVFVKADLEHVQEMVQQRSGRQDRPRTGLRELLSGTREQEPRPAAAEQPAQEPEPGDEHQGEQHDHDGNGSHPARQAAVQGAVAAGLTAAGLAGGALLEARVKPSRKLHIPRRRTRAQAFRDELVKRLP
jgi:hypothetical protein